MEPEQNQNPLLRFYGVVRTRLKILVIVFLTVVMLVAGYSFFATPIYRATCRLLIEPTSLKVAPVQDVYDPVAAVRDFQSRRDFLNTQAELIRSNHILREVFKKFKFGSTKEFRDSKEPLKDLKELIRVNIVRNTHLVDISFDWKDPKFAARVANFIAQVYTEDTRRRRGGFSGHGLERLRIELQQMQRARAKASQALIKFKEKLNIIDLDDAQKLLIHGITELTDALVKAEEEVAIAQASVQAINEWVSRGKNLNDIPEVLRSQTVALYKLERLRAHAKLVESLMDYGAKHRKVLTMRNVIASMDREIMKEIKLTAESAKLTLQRALMRYKIISAKLQAKQKEIIQLDKASGMYRVLKDNLKAAEESFRMVLKRINEVKVVQTTDQDASGGVIMVVAKATPPLEPAFPKKTLNIALSVVVGLFLGLGIVFLLDFLDSTVKTKEQLEVLLGNKPVLGFIPRLGDDENELVALQNPRSRMGESFQTIRTSLGLSMFGRKQRCFQVTSSIPSEGKTLAAINLAISFARDGKKVLLLETDLRRPRINKILGLSDATPGLSNILVGAAEWQDCVLQDPLCERMDIITSGPIPPMPSELIGSQKFKVVLAKFIKAYDMVILDSPPILAVAESSIICGRGVPIIFVTRAFSTDCKTVALAASQIHTVQGKIVGALLNMVDMFSKSYYGYYYSYNYYQTGYYVNESCEKPQ